MASRFQAAALVAPPSYPSSLAWSDENLIAIASAHLVTILNPALPYGPRGLITIPTTDTEVYSFGRLKTHDLLSACLLPTTLFRDRTPCVRSISWSSLGMSPNSGCLLAVCTSEGRVKIYRSPFCDFCAEWIEVMDISDKLYDYLMNTNFGELEIPSPEFASDQATQQEWVDLPNSCDSDLPNPRTTKESKRKKISKTKSGGMEEIQGNCSLPLLTAEQYASRSAMLSSLVVAWSPLLCPSQISSVSQYNSAKRFSILAVGAKSGKISFWRIHAPLCYSIKHGRVPNRVIFVGLLQAHGSWISTISLVVLVSNASQVLLASGSSDGSVKIWLGNGSALLELTEASNAPFCLLKIISVNDAPVSVLSLVPSQSLQKMLLAIGRGSGAFEVWICDSNNCEFEKAGSCNPHGCVVTGLAWAFDGRCLYTCGQDNYVRGWHLCGSSFREVSIPSNTPGLKNSTDLPDVFLSCQGMAVSPGNLVVAMVRSLNVNELDPMYEARAQKAIVEFFWIGAQQLDMISNTSPDFSKEVLLGFPANELVCWESNVLWSLKKCENVDEPLVIWDVIAALLAFKQSIPRFVEHVLVKWLSLVCLGSHVKLTVDEVLTYKSFSKITTRQLHILNIICRRITLSEMKADEINCKENIGITCSEEKQLDLWMKVLLSSENELRERLVGLSCAAFIHLSHSANTTSQPEYWHPGGVAQMQQWIAINLDHVSDQMKVLKLEVEEQKRKNKEQNELLAREFSSEEQCSYCSASVPFDSPEVAFCLGSESANEIVQSHKLLRCAVSMQVCPITPLWFCKCCHRWAFKLAPERYFTMSRHPSDFKSMTESSFIEELSKPLCPFCGILMQRLLPEFLLSASPV